MESAILHGKGLEGQALIQQLKYNKSLADLMVAV